MFLYVCLVLLPAAALASCDPEIQGLFFNSANADNDCEVQRSEADAFLNTLDSDGDKCLSLAEVKSQVPIVAPKLAGNEVPLFTLMDFDKNKCVTKGDLDVLYFIMDTNKNGGVSRPEYDRVLGILCSPDSNFGLGKGGGNNPYSVLGSDN